MYLRYPKIVKCNICNWNGRRFIDDNWLKMVSCPNCYSGIRHRLLLFSIMDEPILINNIKNKRILHFAPESFLIPYLNTSKNYVTADYYRKDVDINLDISNMNDISDCEYDMVIASDVLEHVYDDIKAIYELNRILKFGGIAILTVPQKDNLNKTIEDLSDLSSEERRIKLGQKDHYRIYGYDFYDKLTKAQFNVHIIDAKTVDKFISSKYVLIPPILGFHPMVTNYRKIYHAIKSK